MLQLIILLVAYCIGQNTTLKLPDLSTSMCFKKNRVFNINKYPVIGGLPFSQELVTGNPSQQQTNQAIQWAIEKIGVLVTSDFRQDCLNMHNRYRAILGLRPLSWDASLEASARSYSISLSNKNQGLVHSTSQERNNAGENLYWTSQYSTNACGNALKAFFEEFKYYNGEPVGQNPSAFHEYGHFTAVIWPTTTKVGCAFDLDRNGAPGTYIVCHYKEAGNSRKAIIVQIGRTRFR